MKTKKFNNAKNKRKAEEATGQSLVAICNTSLEAKNKCLELDGKGYFVYYNSIRGGKAYQVWSFTLSNQIITK